MGNFNDSSKYNYDISIYNQDKSIEGNLNVYICGDINDNQNYQILENIFITENASNNGYIKLINQHKNFYSNRRYLYEYRQLEHKIRTIDEKEEKTIYNAFLFINNDVDEEFLRVLFYHFYEIDNHNKRNNVIINFGSINIFQNIMNQFQHYSRESIPIIIHVNDNIQNYDEKLKYINYIPGLDSIYNNLRNNNPNLPRGNVNQVTLGNILKNYLNLKLYRICAYYNEMGYNLNMINPLNETNARIKFHLTIALCGYSGCGKSTFLNLIFKELVSKSVSSATDVTQKCAEYYLPIQNINNNNNNIGQIRFLDFPGITQNDNYQNIVKPTIIKKLKEYKKNLEQIDVALFFIPNRIGREFTSSGIDLVNLLHEKNIKIIFIINGNLDDFLFREKGRRIKNVINNNNILNNNLSNLLSSNFYQYHERESRNGIQQIFEKIIEIIQINIPDYNVNNINVDNYNQQLQLLRENCRVFELFENMSVVRNKAKTHAICLVIFYSALACGSSALSLVVPIVDTFLGIGYQVAMIFNILYVYEKNPNDYNIVNIILSGGNDIHNNNDNNQGNRDEHNNNDNNQGNRDEHNNNDNNQGNRDEVINGNIREVIGDATKTGIFAAQTGIKIKGTQELGKKILEKQIEKVILNEVEIAAVKVTGKSIEGMIVKGSKVIVEKSVEQIAFQSGKELSKELAKKGIEEGVKKVTTEITKEGVIIAAKEGMEEVIFQGTKQTITQVTEQIAIKEGGKKGWIYLGKSIPFIGAGISAFMNTFSCAKLGYKLVNYCDDDFENNKERKVRMLRGRVLALENIIEQIRIIILNN